MPNVLHVSGDLIGLLPGRAACSAGGHSLRFTGTLSGKAASLAVSGAEPGATVRLPHVAGQPPMTVTLLGTPPAGRRSTWSAGTAQDPGSGLVTVGVGGRSGFLDLYLDATGGNSVAVELSGSWRCG